MIKRKHNSLCYYCGKRASSNEHVPPKQMFKEFSCDSITVPSCEEHNHSKGGSDQAIVSALLMPLYNSKEKDLLEPEVLKAIESAEASFERTKYRAIESPLFTNPPESLQDLPDLAYLIPSMDIRGWIRQLTAALVFDGTKTFDSNIKWPETIAWSPDWVASDGPTSLELDQVTAIFERNKEIKSWLEQFTWQDGWSAYPKQYPSAIYSFQVHFAPNYEVIFKHRFYSRYTWYAWFSASNEMVTKLKEKLKTL